MCQRASYSSPPEVFVCPVMSPQDLRTDGGDGGVGVGVGVGVGGECIHIVIFSMSSFNVGITLVQY